MTPVALLLPPPAELAARPVPRALLAALGLNPSRSVTITTVSSFPCAQPSPARRGKDRPQ